MIIPCHVIFPFNKFSFSLLEETNIDNQVQMQLKNCRIVKKIPTINFPGQKSSSARESLFDHKNKV